MPTVTDQNPLSGIALAKRRQLAATLGLFAMLFVAVGAVAATGADTGMVKGFVAVALLVAAVLGLMSWGVVRSVRLEMAEQRLDAAIEKAVAGSGRSMCDCGVEHDPDELHVVDAARNDPAGDAMCAHDGAGIECSHSCTTCVLATMRPSPNRTRAQRLHSA